MTTTLNLRKITATITLAIGAMATATAQMVQAGTYLEVTHVSPKVGTSIGYQFNGQMEVGGFFQRATELQTAEFGRPLRSENEFYGAYLAYPLLAQRVLDVKVNVRTGVSNQQNFVITPSVMAQYKPVKLISIGAGIGTRAFRPSYMASLKINLNGNTQKGQFLALNTK